MRRNIGFKKRNYYNTNSLSTVDNQLVIPEEPSSYIKAFEKTIDALATSAVDQLLTNEIILEKVDIVDIEPTNKIVDTEPDNKLEQEFSLTDDEYIAYVINKLNTQSNTCNNQKHLMNNSETMNNPSYSTLMNSLTTQPSTINQNSIGQSDLDIKNYIIDIFKERNNLETQILNSSLFDIEILKIINTVFNKKLSSIQD